MQLLAEFLVIIAGVAVGMTISKELAARRARRAAAFECPNCGYRSPARAWEDADRG